MSTMRIRVCAIAALIVSHPASAAITIAVSPSSQAVNVSLSQPSGDNYTITATGAASGTIITLSSSNSQDTINNVIVNVPGAGNYVVLNINPSVRSLHGIDKGTGSGELWLRSVIIHGHIGSFANNTRTVLIRANMIETILQSNRNIYADIEATGSEIAGFGAPRINAITVTAENAIYWGEGGLHGSVTSAGSIGDITVAGAIGWGDGNTITATNGNIGIITAGALNGVSISATGTITEVKTTDGGWGGDPTFSSLTVLLTQDPPPLTGPPTIGGDLSALKVERLNLLKGNFQGTLTSTLAMTGTWKIGGSLTAAARINLPANGLQGQIVINSNLQSGAYAGVIKVGMQELGDDYNVKPTLLGGGSGGRVSYLQNRADSNVSPGVVVLDGHIDPEDLREPPKCEYFFNALRLGFYGNLDASSLTTANVTLQRRPLSEQPDCGSDLGWSSLTVGGGSADAPRDLGSMLEFMSRPRE